MKTITDTARGNVSSSEGLRATSEESTEARARLRAAMPLLQPILEDIASRGERGVVLVPIDGRPVAMTVAEAVRELPALEARIRQEARGRRGIILVETDNGVVPFGAVVHLASPGGAS